MVYKLLGYWGGNTALCTCDLSTSVEHTLFSKQLLFYSCPDIFRLLSLQLAAPAFPQPEAKLDILASALAL